MLHLAVCRDTTLWTLQATHPRKKNIQIHNHTYSLKWLKSRCDVKICAKFATFDFVAPKNIHLRFTGMKMDESWSSNNTIQSLNHLSPDGVWYAWHVADLGPSVVCKKIGMPEIPTQCSINSSQQTRPTTLNTIKAIMSAESRYPMISPTG